MQKKDKKICAVCKLYLSLTHQTKRAATLIRHKIMKRSTEKIEPSIAWLYTYKDGDGAVVLDRQDRVLARFDTYEEAIEFAEKNMELILSPK